MALGPEYDCRDCGGRCDTPMLRDDVWRQISSPEDYAAWSAAKRARSEGGFGGRRLPDILCIVCAERRLGRTIHVEDLNNSPWSAAVRAVAEREVQRALRVRDGAPPTVKTRAQDHFVLEVGRTVLDTGSWPWEFVGWVPTDDTSLGLSARLVQRHVGRERVVAMSDTLVRLWPELATEYVDYLPPEVARVQSSVPSLRAGSGPALDALTRPRAPRPTHVPSAG